MSELLLIYSLAFVLGLLFGSFFNVVIHRLPIMMERDWKRQSKAFLGLSEAEEDQARFDLSTPPSRCPNCERPIRWYENLPVISYLAMKGRCTGCQKSISPRYPLVELLTAALTLITVWHFGISLHTAFLAVFVWLLIILTFIDFDTQLLPDSLTLPGLWLGLLSNWYFEWVPLDDALLGAVFGYLSLWSVFWLFKLLTGKEGFGYGDFKLLAMMGAWLGWLQLPVILFLSCLLGAILGGIVVISQRGQENPTQIAFGPYLAIAGLIALFFGNELMSWYLSGF
ncbi:MAG: A24 family peptidase [Pseudomonadota bacterium]|nr:A24 family peptidase [Pseudomonadota bacterium]